MVVRHRHFGIVCGLLIHCKISTIYRKYLRIFVLYMTTLTFVSLLTRALYFACFFWITWGTKVILRKITPNCSVYYFIYTSLILYIGLVFFFWQPIAARQNLCTYFLLAKANIYIAVINFRFKWFLLLILFIRITATEPCQFYLSVKYSLVLI